MYTVQPLVDMRISCTLCQVLSGVPRADSTGRWGSPAEDSPSQEEGTAIFRVWRAAEKERAVLSASLALCMPWQLECLAGRFEYLHYYSIDKMLLVDTTG